MRNSYYYSKKIPFVVTFFIVSFISSMNFVYATKSYAQEASINLEMRNKTVGEVLDKIKNLTEFDFFFNNNQVDLKRKVSVSAKKSDINQILKEVFAGTNVRYVVMDKRIVLTTEVPSANQEKKKVTISGIVTDVTGEPIIGASVVEKSSQGNGTITDINGKFKLVVSSDNTELGISYIGFQTQNVKYIPGKDLKIVLKEDSEMLDEVVVVGYGVQKKRDLTGAISTVKMADEPTATFSTVSHALAGKAAGLRVTQNSGQPGAGATFRIRGETSINAGNSPLIIIDGFPVSSTSNPGGSDDTRYSAGELDNVLESINPNDIESIEVLKDASATAIYGSRAGHGVIIITTKRGKANERMSVSYSGNVSVQTMAKKYDVLDAKGYRTYRNLKAHELWMKTNGQGIYGQYITPNPTPSPFVPRYSDSDIANAQDTDWLSEVTRTGIQHTHNLSLTGGSDKLQFLTSLNYFNQEGIVKNNGMERFTAKMNLDYIISNIFRAGVSFNLSRNSYNNVPLGQYNYENAGIITSAVLFDPSIPVRDKNGKFSVFADQTQFPNPVSLLGIEDKTTKDRVLASGYVQAEPIKGLLLKATLGFDRRVAKRKQYIPNTTLYGAQSGGVAQQTQDDGLDYLMGLTANYMKTLGNHSITALVGYEFQKFTTEGFWLSNYDFFTDGFLYNNIGSGAGVKNGNSSAGLSSLGSYFARINYSYLGRYLMTASIRADGASNFDPSNRWGYFPSVSLAWRINEEPFMKSLSDVISNAKLRVGYGQTGNSNVGNRSTDYFGTGRKWVFGNTGYVGVEASQLGNKKLTWETTTEFNVGFDLGFLKNRINLTAEYYNRVISDLLVTEKGLPSYNELTKIAANIGKTQGQGFELTLNTQNIVSKNFSWSTDVTFYKYVDRWKERDPNWKPYAYESKDDYIRSYYNYHSDGLLKVGEKAPAWQHSLLPGQIKIQNVKDQPDSPNVIDQYDQYLLGSKDPAFSFGFNNTLSYKNFDFNVYFYGEVGRLRSQSYYDGWIPYLEANDFNMSSKTLNSWRADNQNTNVPSILISSYTGGDFFMKKIFFVRCRNLTLGYNLPLKKSKIAQNIRVYADVNNPFVITNWTGLDPETDQDLSSYPNVRSFSLGLDIRF